MAVRTKLLAPRLLWALLLVGCAAQTTPPAASAPTGRARPAQAAETITAEDVHARIGFLASDALQGRGTPSPGLEVAAEYLASEFRAMGLESAADSGRYIQRYPFRKVALEPSGVRLIIENPQGMQALIYGREFLADAAIHDSASGTPVFLGPITQVDSFPPEVSGQIAVVTLGRREIGPEVLVAARRAAETGASGLLYVLHPVVTPEEVAELATTFATEALELPIPTFGVRLEHARVLFRAAGLDPRMLADTAALAAPVRVPRTLLRMFVPAQRTESRAPNVVAVLPGSDPQLRREYIVLTAHFDHLGVGAPDSSGDSIYNGADDNASGTAVLLELAEAFATLSERPARSIVFLAVSGEERGLVGSRYFVDHPTIPIEQVVANINMDVVGRNAPDTVIAIGQEYTSLGPLAQRIAQENPQLGLNIIADPLPEEQALFRSDHVAFMRKGIPAIQFFTGAHPDTHRPSDEIDKINPEKAARVGRLVFWLTHELASTPERPVWLGDSLERVREMLKAAPF
jgi:hypothetical protein